MLLDKETVSKNMERVGVHFGFFQGADVTMPQWQRFGGTTMRNIRVFRFALLSAGCSLLVQPQAWGQTHYACFNDRPCDFVGVGKAFECDSVDYPGGYPYAVNYLDHPADFHRVGMRDACEEKPPRRVDDSKRDSDTDTRDTGRNDKTSQTNPDGSIETAAANAADKVLSTVDGLLGEVAKLASGPAPKGTRLTYISFANHNGLQSDRLWGVGVSTGNMNEAAGLALSSCNAKIPFGLNATTAPQCGSDASCTLQTGQWAAHAVSKDPFMNSDGPYVTKTSCGLPTKAAAEADVLQNCQSNEGGPCEMVWSDSGK